MIDPDEEEEEELRPVRRGRPRPAYLNDTYTAAFRAVPTPHSGDQKVRADDTLGTLAECWCGLPWDHDWPGKIRGRKHPKGATTMVQDVASLDRNMLRAYHHTIAEFILHEVRVNGLKFRVKSNAVLLYPPDGSPPMSVYARNTDRQLRILASWHSKHVEDYLQQERDAEVVEDAARVLAEKLNDPVEHPVPDRSESGLSKSLEFQDTPANPVEYLPSPSREALPGEGLPEGWYPHIGTEGNAIDGIITNGERYVCTYCADTDHPLNSVNQGSIGGHRRMWHSPDSTEFRRQAAEGARNARAVGATRQAAAKTTTPPGTGKHKFTREDHAKQGQAKRWNATKVKEAKVALEQMCEALAYYPVDPSSAGREAAGGKDFSDTERSILTEQLAEATRRADDAEAKLAILREAMGL